MSKIIANSLKLIIISFSLFNLYQEWINSCYNKEQELIDEMDHLNKFQHVQIQIEIKNL